MILVQVRELYVSDEGEKWEITEDDDKRLFIRYTPKLASGGWQRILTVDPFLSPEHSGLQQEAFKKLVEDGELFINPARTKQYLA
jgi:hypothetical protein